MKSTSKILIFSLIPTITVGALLGLGFLIGRYMIIKDFDQEFQITSQASFLGNLLSEEQKKEIIRVYHDGEKVSTRLDKISWAVPNILTPFVGNAPLPGRHGVAYINSMQFRAIDEVEMPKPGNTCRIFITGGSAAYGSGASSQESTIAGYLGNMLSARLTPLTNKKYEVYTMANPAWASTHERIVIENRLSEMTPDLVISFSGCNDVHWGSMGRNVLWFRAYYDEFFLSLIKKVYKITNQPEIPEVTRIEPAAIPSSLVSERLVKNVELSSFVISRAGIDYLFVLQPVLAVSGKNLTKREQGLLTHQDYFRDCYARIDIALKGINRDNFQYADLSGVFDGLGGQEDIFLDSYHIGDKGNEMIAESIFLLVKDRLSQ
ncbi:MAG: hypothetical protein ABIJ42_04120 [Acidobacteriota bacterium]